MAVEKSVVRSVRFSPDEWGRVETWATEAGVSPSRYVREATLRRRPPARPAGVRADAVTALNRVGRNLNQLVRLLHQARRDHAAGGAGGAAAEGAAAEGAAGGAPVGAPGTVTAAEVEGVLAELVVVLDRVAPFEGYGDDVAGGADGGGASAGAGP